MRAIKAYLLVHHRHGAAFASDPFLYGLCDTHHVLLSSRKKSWLILAETNLHLL
jgi:hypothetical protein